MTQAGDEEEPDPVHPTTHFGFTVGRVPASLPGWWGAGAEPTLKTDLKTFEPQDETIKDPLLQRVLRSREVTRRRPPCWA